MKTYRYNNKQFIKLNNKELNNLRQLLYRHAPRDNYGTMISPINSVNLDKNKLNFGECIGCSWLQVLCATRTGKSLNLDWANTYLKRA